MPVTEIESFIIGMIIGSLLLVVGVLLFVINVFTQLNANQLNLSNKDITM